MDLGLRESVAVVVGGASGIGRAIAATFTAEGARVALFDVSPMVATAASELGGRGWQVDVTDYPAISRVAADARAHFGRVDHVVFAAAVGSGKFGFPFWKREETRNSRERLVF